MTRLEKLQEFLKSDPKDSFTRYAIGLEFRSAKDYASAISMLSALADDDPNYVPTYYQLADCYRQIEDVENARNVYMRGMAIAKTVRDTHALSELQSALDELDDM